MAVIPEPFIRENYRGLNDEESNLLRDFLLDQDREILSLETRVVVGPGEQLDDSQPESFRRSWQESSKFKIDAAVELPGEIRLVELKDFGRTSFLGQLLMYDFWLEVERDFDKPKRLWLSTPDLNPSSVQPTQFQGVQIHVQSPIGEKHLRQGEEAQPPFE